MFVWGMDSNSSQKIHTSPWIPLMKKARPLALSPRFSSRLSAVLWSSLRMASCEASLRLSGCIPDLTVTRASAEVAIAADQLQREILCNWTIKGRKICIFLQFFGRIFTPLVTLSLSLLINKLTLLVSSCDSQLLSSCQIMRLLRASSHFIMLWPKELLVNFLLPMFIFCVLNFGHDLQTGIPISANGLINNKW